MSTWPTPLLAKALGIVLLGVAVGLVANYGSPVGIPLRTPPKKEAQEGEFIPLDQAKKLWESGGAVFIDAREPADFAAGHIGNALNLPVQSFAQHFGELAPVISSGLPLVLYCDGKECDLSHRLAANLRQQGQTNVHILFNGWTAWREAGFPVTPGGAR